MAKPQLYRIVKDASEIYNMLEDDQEISDWMESYIAKAETMISSVHKKLDHKGSPSNHGHSLGPVIKYKD